MHDIGTGYGHPTDPIDGEVIVRLDSDRNSAFGFPLQVGKNEAANRQKLDLLRASFVRNRTVKVEYVVSGPENGQILRVIGLR